MKRHPAWFAAGLLLLVVLACNLGKTKNTNESANSNSTANTNSADDSGSGTYLSEVHMAKDDGSGDPGEETNSFAPSDRTIHCVAKLKEAKSGTRMKFTWWIVDADGTKDEKIKDIDYTTRALENTVHGHLTLPQDWPAGKYKVDVAVNGAVDKTVYYSVR